MQKLLSSTFLMLFAFSAAADPTPRVISTNPSPGCSDLATRAAVQGAVELKVLIGAEGGAPKHIEVTGQLGWGLDEQAVNAVSQWKFSPADSEGKSIESKAKVECHFFCPGKSDPKFGAMAFDLPNGVSKPIMTSFVPPDFVREFGAGHEAGKVEFTVSEHGEPENFHVEKASSPGMEKAVFEALRQWRFEPAMRNSEAVSVRGSLTYESVGR